LKVSEIPDSNMAPVSNAGIRLGSLESKEAIDPSSLNEEELIAKRDRTSPAEGSTEAIANNWKVVTSKGKQAYDRES
jgi:hypothetical protein